MEDVRQKVQDLVSINRRLDSHCQDLDREKQELESKLEVLDTERGSGVSHSVVGSGTDYAAMMFIFI